MKRVFCTYRNSGQQLAFALIDVARQHKVPIGDAGENLDQTHGMRFKLCVHTEKNQRRPKNIRSFELTTRYRSASRVRNLEHSHDASQTFGHPKSHTLGQPAKGQS